MKKLVEKRSDIAFFLKVFVLVSPDPKTAKSVVCSKSLAELEDAYAKKPVPSHECSSKDLDDNMRFARENGITAAPALVFPDATVQLGYSVADQLEKRIDEAVQNQKREDRPESAK
jgi:protein-disulfide isomerase